ncbi:hypothetical protein B0A80_20415, partial [Flavobacterium tructae]|uniref:AMP-binding protein n=1 Tax=Flavobacterium tructae TaxID=1114873 RepID=UPI000B64B6A3
NQLAHYLLSKYDIQAEELIGIVLDRSDWLIVSFLAVLKTGAAYIPIDPEYPQERKEVIKKDSGTRIIIDNLFLVKFKENQFKYSKDLIEIAIRHDNLAYVIYTSGSTGKPKGVMVGHKNLVNLSFWHQSRYSVDQKSRGTLFSGIGFDASVWEIYPYLLFGASLYPVSEKERYDLNLLSKFLIENAITHAYIPTSLCMSFIDQEISIPNISFLTGGEVLNLHKLTDIIVYNNYGPTETTVVASSYKISNTSLGLIPIGKPIANTQIYILDSALELVPIGVVGELCISGDGLARGY